MSSLGRAYFALLATACLGAFFAHVVGCCCSDIKGADAARSTLAFRLHFLGQQGSLSIQKKELTTHLSSAKKAGCDSHESFFLVKHSHRLNQRSSVGSDALSLDSAPIFTLVQEFRRISPQQKRIPNR